MQIDEDWKDAGYLYICSMSDIDMPKDIYNKHFYRQHLLYHPVAKELILWFDEGNSYGHIASTFNVRMSSIKDYDVLEMILKAVFDMVERSL